MRIGVLTIKQTLGDKPWIHISKSRSEELLSGPNFIKISKRIIKEVVAGSIQSSSPERHHVPKLKVVIIPKLNPPGPDSTLNLFYPVHDMSSYSSRNMRELWSCPKEEFAQKIGFAVI